MGTASSSKQSPLFTAPAGVIGDGNPLEEFPLSLTGSLSFSSFTSSGTTASLLGAGVMLWLDPRLAAFFLARPLIGRVVEWSFGAPLVAGTEDFLKKPARDVWFLELEVDFFSEAGGAGVPLGVFAEGAIAFDKPRKISQTLCMDNEH